MVIHGSIFQSTKSSITKVLIYHVNSSNNSMLINQIRKPKDDSPMLLDYLLSTKDQCQVAVLECANVISIFLFENLFIFFLLVHLIQRIVCIFSSPNNLSGCFERGWRTQMFLLRWLWYIIFDSGTIMNKIRIFWILNNFRKINKFDWFLTRKNRMNNFYRIFNYN
jgi:hypothetical protein